MKKVTLTSSFVALALFSVGAANAAPYVVNVPLNDIGTAFDNVINLVEGDLFTVGVERGKNSYEVIGSNGNSMTITVTRPNGSSPSFSYNDPYKSGGVSLSGTSWTISPSRSSSDPIPGFNSGLTFTFSSPVNAFGLEIGDWATCCMTGTRADGTQGSGLWIAFDGGAATLPANALTHDDNPGYAAGGSYTNFIGAIDSSGTFSSITFFGDGFGEYLVAGGTLRFAAVPLGSVDVGGPTTPIPEPETYAMFLAGLAVIGAVSRHRRRQE